MSLPEFAMNDLLPPGVHSATEADVWERCVDSFPTSTTRGNVFKGLCAYRNDVSTLSINLTQWVDGSFTDRTRIDPDDIDLVNFAKSGELNALLPASQPVAKQLLDGREHTKAEYSCHSFLVVYFPVGHPYEAAFENNRKYWRKWWATPQYYSSPAVKLPAPQRGSKGIIKMTVGDSSKAPKIETRP